MSFISPFRKGFLVEYWYEGLINYYYYCIILLACGFLAYAWSFIMKTTLTRKNLEILYNMACQMPPFNNLPMPKSDKVKFRVIKNPTIYGCFDEVDMAIEISSGSCGHFITIFQTLLHEMVHLALYVRGDDDFDQHGAKFMRIKDVYSELYNFDPKAI
jgi:hypothetical protein